ncbi:MAG TPA: hypothetical protein VD793_05075 [Gemmatimonadales bacterium]|nr:hypothetical protein [Gemmatimonadales bacterium]
MPRSRVPRRLAVLSLLPALGACAVLDLFEAAGPGDVAFQFTGETSFRTGDRHPFAVTVSVDGVPLDGPRLLIQSTDTTVVALAPAGDSLIAVKPGRADLYIRLQQSLLVGEYPDTVITLRVAGGPPT